MFLLWDGGSRGYKSSNCIGCGKGHSYLRFGGGNYGYDGVVVKNVGINSVLFMIKPNVLQEVWLSEKGPYWGLKHWNGCILASRAARSSTKTVLDSSYAPLSMWNVQSLRTGLWKKRFGKIRLWDSVLVGSSFVKIAHFQRPISLNTVAYIDNRCIGLFKTSIYTAIQSLVDEKSMKPILSKKVLRKWNW